MTDLKRHEVNEIHTQLRDGLADVVLRHTNQDDIALNPVEILAVIGDLVGGIVAIQSQVALDLAIDIVTANINNGFNGTMARIVKAQGDAVGNQTGALQ